MFVAIGWVVVMASVIGSFVGVGGHLPALVQPFELLCIFGAAIGAFVVSNPTSTLKKTIKAIPSCFKSGGYTKEKYLELMALLYELLPKARKEGTLTLEADVIAPEESVLFKKYPNVLTDHHIIEFIVDYLRLMVGGNMNVLEIESLMDEEIGRITRKARSPAQCAAQGGDAMPAFGIVAAVMGVVHTMASADQPPAMLGEMIAQALVGTFLGILLSYGLIGPLASVAEQRVAESTKMFQCIKVTISREPERLRAGDCRRVRPQGALLDRASVVRRAGRARAPRQERKWPDADGCVTTKATGDEQRQRPSDLRASAWWAPQGGITAARGSSPTRTS